MEDAAKQFLRLLYFKINNIDDRKEEIESFDFERIYYYSRIGAVSALINRTLEDNGIKDVRFMETFENIIWHQIMLRAELDAIKNDFESNAIAFIKLKGLVINGLYPDSFLREMGDMDILISSKNRNKVKKLMESLGYNRVKSESTHYDDMYKKGEIIVEIHYRLLYGGKNDAWKKFDRAICADLKGNNDFDMTWKQQYIYFITHAYRHWYGALGIGIRFLIDLYYIKKTFPDISEDHETKKIIKEMQMDDFEQKMITLCDLIFDEDVQIEDMTAEQKEWVQRLVEGGLNGQELKTGQIVSDDSEIKDRGWWQIYKHSLAEMKKNKEWMSFNTPFAYKHPAAAPISLLAVSAKRVINDPGGMIKRYGGIRGKKED